MDGRFYVLEIEGYDGDDTGIETWQVSGTTCGSCGHGLARHQAAAKCGSRGCKCSWFLPIKPTPLFAIVEIKKGRAVIIDNGYRSRREALVAWPEANRRT